MKSFLLLFMSAIFIFISSCENKVSKQAGNIPGMGNAGGELQAVKYDFHNDLTLGAIVGIGDSPIASSLKAEELIISGSAYGSGDQVVVELSITNSNPDDCRSAWFRAGTVFASSLTGVQNAILLSPVNVCVPPGATKEITLHLYCLNLGMANPDGDDSYEMLGVTSSSEVMSLVNALQFKMVNYEHYELYGGAEWFALYNDIKSKLQAILWDITNGDGSMLDEESNFIKNLPNLPEGVLPEHIYELEIPLPDCWCIDECNVVKNSGALSNVIFYMPCSSTPKSVPFVDEGYYYTNGFPFEVTYGFSENSLEGTYPELRTRKAIKFDAIDEMVQLGDNGVDIATFVIETTCQDAQIYVITKNKDEVFSKIDLSQVGEAVLMTNGFMVEFVSIAGSDVDGYTYTFNVVSDKCTGGETNTNKG